jgi:hexokinase
MKTEIKDFLNQNNFFQYKQYQSYIDALDLEICNALSKHNTNHIYFPDRLDQFSTPKQDTPFVTMDLGGMYLRLSLCKTVKGKIKTLQAHKVSFYEDKTYTPEVLFTDLKTHLDNFLENISPKPEKLVFSFAYALKPQISKKNKLDGEILFLGKNHRQSGLIGINLGQEMQKFLRARGYPGLDIFVINDSSLALLSAKMLQKHTPPAVLSLVVGSGTNISVGYDTIKGFKVFNLEFGNFDFFPYSNFDDQLNHQSLTPNKFRTEKLYSGTWQHLLFRVILEKALRAEIIKSDPRLTPLKKMSSLELEDLFHQKDVDLPSLSDLKDIWKEINIRGSLISALGIFTVIRYLQANHIIDHAVTVLEVGALLEHCHEFRHNFEKYLLTLLEKHPKMGKIKPEFILSSDPTCNGAVTLLTLCHR